MKRSNVSKDPNCYKKDCLDVPEAFKKLSFDEKKKLVWSTEFPNCANIRNKYEMISHLGQGTYGIVYKAREIGTRNYVALKKVLPNTEYGGVPITAIREIRILQQLKHDNIICFLEVCKENTIFYMALEYCEVSLEEILKVIQIQLTCGVKKTILNHLLNGLLFMHKNFILHRDIKPANLLITKGGTLKIADFGLARPIHECADNSKQVFSNCVVTLWYRAPELLLGERCYNSAIDIWSAGCVMAELWTRSALMTGSTEQEQLFLILKLCGSITKDNWTNVERLPLYTGMELPKHNKRRVNEVLSSIINDVNGMNLLDDMLVLDPEKRIDADTALNHNFFWSEPYPESLIPFLSLYRKIQNQHNYIPQRVEYAGYVDHIF